MDLASGMAGWSGAWPVGLEIAARATIVLALGLVAQHTIGRRRPAIGGAIGHACLLMLILLPLATLLGPRLSLAWLPAERAVPADVLVNAGPQPDFSARLDPAMMPAPEPAATEPTQSDEATPIPAPLASTIPAPSAPPATTRPARSWRPSWPAVGLVAYALIAGGMLVRLASSLAAVRRLRLTAIPVDDPGWRSALERCRQRLGIRRPVSLAWTAGAGIPLVFGWLRPTILLPDSLAEPDARGHADAILLHELSHVRRADYPWNQALRVVQAIYWPHPFVWLLGRSIAEARERTCDAVCVHALGDASSYGETLLAVAAGLARRPAPALGLAMARGASLGKRLERIAAERGEAHPLPRQTVRVLIAGIAIAAAIVGGAVRLTRAQSQEAKVTKPPTNEKAAAPQASSPSKGRVFHLQVVAADTGKPVPNAWVRVWIALDDDWRRTDENGRIDIVHSAGPADRRLSVDVWGDGRAMQRHQWGLDPGRPIPESDTIRLLPGETLGGIVQDEQGRPIQGATVYLWSHNYKKKDPHELLFDLRATTGPDGRWWTSGAPETTGELLGFYVVHPDYLSGRGYNDKEPKPKIADLRAGKAVSVMKKGVPIEGRVVDANGRPVAGARVLTASYLGEVFSRADRFEVTTDDRGHFRTAQVAKGRWFLLAQAKGRAPGETQVRIDQAVPQVQIAMGRPHAFQGRVLDTSGRPIEGASVNIDTWHGYRFFGVHLDTDADGRFRWDDAPEDAILVDVDCQGYRGLFQQKVQAADGNIAEFRMAPSLPIHGNVKDAETGKPIDEAAVAVGAVDPKTGEVSAWTNGPELGVEIGVYQGRLDFNFPVTADAYRIRITADGFEPFVSRVFRREEKVVGDYDIKLVPGRARGPLATVVRPDGRPLAGARVHSARLNEIMNIADGVVTSQRGSGRELLTGADGTFSIPDHAEPFVVLILGDDAYALASKDALAKSPRIQARPYGRVEGRYFVGPRAMPDQPMEIRTLFQEESTMYCTVSFHAAAATNRDGDFAFDRVIPLPHLRVGPQPDRSSTGRAWSLGEPVHVAPGETARITVGGKGRPVVGRVLAPEGWTNSIDFTDRSMAGIESNRPYTPYPPELFRGKATLNDGAWSRWSNQWRKTPEGIAYLDSRVASHVNLAPDGSFRFDDLPAGEYRLTVHVNEEGGRERGPFARVVKEFTVPMIPGTRRPDPLDIGEVRLTVRKPPKAGEPAPDFQVTTTDGKPLSLADYRGKYLLLDFGVLWDHQCRLQIARLNPVFERFGEDERFAMLSLVMAADDERSRAFVAAKGEPWPQVIVGPMSNTLSIAYGIEDSVPAAILIGPDGKIVARDLWYNGITEAIGKALGK
ncbi:MAG: carboxypeptidase regulatory-like domain-containing protein [Isosphaeraceae bacterium]